ncbi:hypothetical protein LG296_01710 [Ureibacillus chungkukjangi]|uniref:hypothetical protein n=1 Tax=Ureibacillus chungkukjangi TaxID=1202712 RepID=UPI00384B1417
MIIDYSSVLISDIDFAAEGNSEIFQNLKTLYTTIAGTVPFDREFGINIDFLDMPIPLAQGRLIVEYAEKTSIYEPRASVKEVDFEVDTVNGKLIPKVVIEVVSES